MSFRKNFYFFLLLGFFLSAYLLLGIQKYNRFETGDDLALYSQALWHYSNLRVPFSSFKDAIILTDHFGPILAIFSPFYWLWQDPRSLIAAQQIIVVLGTIPVYIYCQKKLKSLFYSLAISFLYLYFIGIQSAVYADFHLATIATTFLAFLIYFLELKKWRWYWIFLILCLICKEDMPAYVFGISIYLIIAKKEYKIGAIGALVSLFYFYSINNFFLPLLNKESFRLGNLGGKSITYISILFSDPADFLNNFIYPAVKIRNIIFILLSFGFLPIFSLLFWFVAPFNFLRFFSDPARYSLHFHYTAGLTPILAFSFINILAKVKIRHLKTFFVITALAGNIYVNRPDLDPGFFTPPITRIFKREFWVLPPRNKDYFQMISLIPAGVSVSGQTAILPQMAHRDKIYRFPQNYLDSDYVLLTPTEGTYPITVDEYEKIKMELENSKNHRVVFNSYAGILFQKTTP